MSVPDFEFQLDTPIAKGMQEFFRLLESRLELDCPLTVFLAGGMGVHLYTAKRVTTDIDAEFSGRVAVPTDLFVPVELPDGSTEDIHDLVYAGLTSAAEIEFRAEEALSYFIGNTSSLRLNIRDALEIARSAERERAVAPKFP